MPRCAALALMLSLADGNFGKALVAQDSAAVVRPRLCLRGEQKPRCQRFVLTELGYYVPIATSRATYPSVGGGNQTSYRFSTPDADRQLSFGFGAMTNRGSHSAVGGAMIFGFGPSAADVGVVGRYRRWLTADGVAVDFSTGIIQGSVVGPSFGYSKALGVTGEVALNAADYGAVVLRANLLHGKERNASALFLGARLGSKPALFGSAIYATGVLLILAALSGSDF